MPEFNIEDFKEILKEFAAYKAPGPDYLEADLFKCLPDSGLMIIVNHVNQWILTGQQDTEQLKARVASLFKKGNFRNAENYRPISLLNTIYKIKARIIKNALETGIEKEIQKTQFAFRKIAARCNLSTASDDLWTKRNVQETPSASCSWIGKRPSIKSHEAASFTLSDATKSTSNSSR